MTIQDALKQRILILDGAMGTMIQRYNLSEDDYRGKLFAEHSGELKGNNDLLCLTQPHIVSEIHEAYLRAGSDIIETNTFNATSISMSDYGMQNYVSEINFKAAQLAREAADKYTTKEKPRFVAGSIGPTNKTTSMSPDVNNPAFRSLSYDDLFFSYIEQIKALLAGADGVLVSGCHPNDCHYSEGNYYARRRLEVIKRFLPVLGIEPLRFEYTWVSAAEAKRWQEVVTAFTEQIHALPPVPRLPDDTGIERLLRELENSPLPVCGCHAGHE